MQDIIELHHKDLTLSVEFDITKIDLSIWDDYLDILCGTREYQKNAIKNALNFLIGGKYNSLRDLVKENYKKSLALKELGDLDSYLKSIILKDKMFANIDLATGTGKSYVMYGIAQIMLAMEKIERVLVLCPTITIEDGLSEKFKELANNVELLNAIPEPFKKIIPTIIDANSTISQNCICIENIHVAYEKTGSSIKDSFDNKKGTNTLILNDESHHIFNMPTGTSSLDDDFKKWADFLLDKEYEFKYILGFTGTAYIGNDYFKDVIYRYSLKDAIEENIVKNVEYVQEYDDEEHTKKEEEKFQVILQTHAKNKQLYGNKLKPITILITKDTSVAQKLKNKLESFIVKSELNKNPEINEDDLQKSISSKILLITHKSSFQERMLLKQVDDSKNPVEFIISVSMLNEGWDVKNVFQIVPMEEKAFNSKLLISQVLGRGLRTPEGVKNPKVVVMNHDSWGKNIKALVEEILEIETKIEISNSTKRDDLHFSIFNIDYTKFPEEVTKSKNESNKLFDYNNIAKNGISLESQASHRTVGYEFEDIKGSQTKREYSIKRHSWTIDEVLDKLFKELSSRNWEGVVLQIDGLNYSKENLPPREKIRDIIEKSLIKTAIPFDSIEDKNVQRILSSFSTLLRKTNKTVEYKTIANKPYRITTKEANREYLGLSNFRKDYCLFYSSTWDDEIESPLVKEVVTYFLNEESFPRSSSKEVRPELFKTPYNFVVTSSKPEKQFVEYLIKKEVADQIFSWVKSKNKGFYSIEYRMKGGSPDSNNREYKSFGFNPDFFLKIKKENINYTLVIEIKADGDFCSENKAKLKYGRMHFNQLNKELLEQDEKEQYIFHMLCPSDFPAFFDAIKNGTMFNSDVEFNGALELGLMT